MCSERNGTVNVYKASTPAEEAHVGEACLFPDSSKFSPLPEGEGGGSLGVALRGPEQPGETGE